MPEEKIYDISRPISPATPVWPGDEPLYLSWTARIRDGGASNLATVRMGLHVGTHADAPFHVLDGATRVGDLPLVPFIGPARLVEVTAGRSITPADIADALAERPERILIRTNAWTGSEGFPDHFAALSPAAADALVQAGVRLVGTDAPSVDPFDSPDLPAHRRLLGAGIPILENLDLATVPEGTYELIALPLKLTDADASPVRAILRGLPLHSTRAG